ncbi:hypothetical protein [Nocardiopsis sp. JB363]|uniref:hypothetical protein n=1 Tax=Nocardiopsis sp. JB363 TaxID=1434837 RepID=UPI000979DC3D|nr:hypothetical protein [Nocardiopsis sp. JB363]SIO90809.1 hypothetical protein BQ8420_28555 [Nocardiopsis sp. JB363]
MDLPFHDLVLPHTGAVTHTRPATGGSGFATAVFVHGEAGAFFVKAVPNRPGGRLDAARREALVNPALLGLAPRLLFQAEDEGWFVTGFEIVDGHHPGYDPGSPDLPKVAQVVDQITDLVLPETAVGWQETRWDRFTDRADLLAGDTLTYTDLHPNNILIDGDRTWVVDWEWPTLAAGHLTAGSLVGQLIASGHSPIDAESWVSAGAAWKAADPAAVDEFARAQVRMQEWIVEQLPDQEWRKAMLAAAQKWCRHREELKAGR